MKMRVNVARHYVPMLLAMLPLGALAQTGEKPFVCIEKTNGDVVKVLITETSPNLLYDIVDREGKKVSNLRVMTADGKEIVIPCAEVKTISTQFESATAVSTVSKSETDVTTGVYSLGGVRVGSSESIKNMPKGVYVEKKGSKTVKHLK